MDFNELVKKYNNDTATPEEIQYVESTVNQAREIAKTRLKGDKHVGFGQKIKRFFVKLLILVLLVAGLFAYCYLSITNNARDNVNLNKNQADSAVTAFLAEELNLLSNQISISKFERKLVPALPFSRSYYLYKYTVETTSRGSYNLIVDSYSQNIEYGKN